MLVRAVLLRNANWRFSLGFEHVQFEHIATAKIPCVRIDLFSSSQVIHLAQAALFALAEQGVGPNYLRGDHHARMRALQLHQLKSLVEPESEAVQKICQKPMWRSNRRRQNGPPPTEFEIRYELLNVLQRAKDLPLTRVQTPTAQALVGDFFRNFDMLLQDIEYSRSYGNDHGWHEDFCNR